MVNATLLASMGCVLCSRPQQQQLFWWNAGPAANSPTNWRINSKLQFQHSKLVFESPQGGPKNFRFFLPDQAQDIPLTSRINVTPAPESLVMLVVAFREFPSSKAASPTKRGELEVNCPQ